jgi:hypothetical protein
MAPEHKPAMVANMNHALNYAKVIGFNDDGHACVWSGGYTFNVYDAAGDWGEVRHFTSGAMVDYSNEEKARKRMEDEGFEVFEK